jgi:hypothetical protein
MSITFAKHTFLSYRDFSSQTAVPRVLQRVDAPWVASDPRNESRLRAREALFLSMNDGESAIATKLFLQHIDPTALLCELAVHSSRELA